MFPHHLPKMMRTGVGLVGALILSCCVVAIVPQYSLAASSKAKRPAEKLPAGYISDARLKSALQKRLMVPDLKQIHLGPVIKSPIPGIYQRTITISSETGQPEGALEYLSNERGEQGILARQFGFLNVEDPWQHVDISMLHLKDRPTLGPADAPITIVEFADFECPYCAHAFPTMEALVNDTYKGKVRLIWKNYPLTMHPWAEQAAIAAECAREQNPEAFWSFARDLYHNQDKITPQNLRPHIEDFAKSIGLDTKALNACILGSSAEARVEQDMKDAKEVHVMSTPTFFVNGVPVVGIPGGNLMQELINSELKRAEHHAGASH